MISIIWLTDTVLSCQFNTWLSDPSCYIYDLYWQQKHV